MIPPLRSLIMIMSPTTRHCEQAEPLESITVSCGVVCLRFLRFSYSGRRRKTPARSACGKAAPQLSHNEISIAAVRSTTSPFDPLPASSFGVEIQPREVFTHLLLPPSSPPAPPPLFVCVCVCVSSLLLFSPPLFSPTPRHANRLVHNKSATHIETNDFFSPPFPVFFHCFFFFFFSNRSFFFFLFSGKTTETPFAHFKKVHFKRERYRTV